MKRTVTLIAIIVMSMMIPVRTHAQNRPDQKNGPLSKYMNFIKTGGMPPVEYVFSLFETADIVVWCERGHPEITQYDLIKAIIGDKRFIEQGGAVFTEIGMSSIQPEVEKFLMNGHLTEDEITGSILHIIRNLEDSPLWTCTNYSVLLRGIYEINRSLPPEKKIHLYPSGMPFSWDGMTAEKYADRFKNVTKGRDKVIADRIIEKYDEIRSSGGKRTKALVIMNYRHAFPHLDVKIDDQARRVMNVTGYLMERYPSRVSNVMLNFLRLTFGPGNSIVWSALQDGKWDAAFALAGNPDRGFNFKGSPFGSDKFDNFPYQHDYTYSDIFTGFIFYLPMEQHVMCSGYPGIFTEEFKKEFASRWRIKKPDITDKEIAEKIDRRGKLNKYPYDNKDEMGKSNYKELIAKWLKK